MCRSYRTWNEPPADNKFKRSISAIPRDRHYVCAAEDPTTCRGVECRCLPKYLNNDKYNNNMMLIAYDSTMGLDVRITDFVTMSEGIKIDNPKFLRYSIRRLNVLQRELRQKKKWLFNFLRVDGLWQRRLTTEGTESAESCFFLGGICARCGFPNPFQKLIQTLLGLGQFEPASRICSVCGSINRSLKLSDPKWTCAECVVLHDRDVNERHQHKEIRTSGSKHDWCDSTGGQPG